MGRGEREQRRKGETIAQSSPCLAVAHFPTFSLSHFSRLFPTSEHHLRQGLSIVLSVSQAVGCVLWGERLKRFLSPKKREFDVRILRWAGIGLV